MSDAMAPVAGIRLLDWDCHRSGIFLGYVDVDLKNLNMAGKREVLRALAMNLMEPRSYLLPERATLIDPSVIRELIEKHGLTSLNFRICSDEVDPISNKEIRIFVMSETSKEAAPPARAFSCK